MANPVGFLELERESKSPKIRKSELAIIKNSLKLIRERGWSSGEPMHGLWDSFL